MRAETPALIISFPNSIKKEEMERDLSWAWGAADELHSIIGQMSAGITWWILQDSANEWSRRVGDFVNLSIQEMKSCSSSKVTPLPFSVPKYAAKAIISSPELYNLALAPN